MAQITQGRVDIISRENGTLLSQANGGASRTVSLTEPSVVRISGTRAMVVQYERQGDDLILHMRDGSTVRYQKFFFDDVNGEHSELVFDDGVNPAEHALFPTTASQGTDLAAASVTPTYESLNSVEPLLLADSNNVSTGVIAASGLGILGLAGIAVGASGGGGGGGGGGGNDGTPAPNTPTITVNTFAGDDVLDNGEKATAQTLSGSTTNVEAGQVVTITLNGQTYNATVGADGTWSVSLPPSALAALASGEATLTVTVNNAAGATANAQHDFTVTAPATDPGAPTLSIATFAGDDVLDNGEKGASQTISGLTTNVPAGQVVTVTLNGQNYNATVGADGSWSVSVPSSALAALAAGSTTITATVSNGAGENASGAHSFIVATPDVTEPTLNITQPLSGDGYLNAQEAGTSLVVNGTSANISAGTSVTVSLNGVNYTGTISPDGSWSITVPASALSGLPDGPQSLVATATDSNGDAVSSTASLNVAINNLPDISVDLAALQDGILNASEAGSDLNITGNTGVTGAGQTLTLTLGGVEYNAVVNNDGSWTLTIPTAALQNLPQGPGSLTLTASDVAGNSSSETVNFTVDTTTPVLTFEPLAGDNVLNNAEAAADLDINGTGQPGNTVTVELNNQTYSAVVDGEGNWTITLPQDALAALADGSSYAVTISQTDTSGNVTTVSQTLAVDTTLPVLTVNTPAVDGTINNNEQQQPLTLSGTGGVGETVNVSLNNQTYTAVVDQNGQWSVTVPQEAIGGLTNGDYPLTVTLTDGVGNSTTQESTLSVSATAPLLTVEPLGEDGIINANELTQPLVIVGTGNEGDTISVTLNGQTYTATVEDGGQWSITVPSADLAQITSDSVPVTIVATDALGNTTTNDSTLDFSTTPPVVVVNAPGGDGYINSTEHGQDLVLSGSGGTEGNTVVVSLDNTNYTTTVDADGNWTVTVPADTVGELTDGTYPVSVTVTDVAGNSTTTVSDVTVIATDTPTLTLNTFAGDNVVDSAEQLTDQLFTGTTTNVTAGQVVTVTVNGVDYQGTVQADGSWSVTLPAGSTSGLTGSQDYSVSVSDIAGNSTTQTGTFSVVTSADPVLSIAPISVDNALNAQEAAADLTISGSSANLPADSIVTVSLGGNTYSSAVAADGSWSVTVPVADLSALPQGDQTVTVTSAGAETSQTLLVATTPLNPPTLETPFTDGILNSDEVNAVQTLTGSTGNTGAGQAVTVTLGGTDYPATVDGDGNWSLELPPAVLQGLNEGSNPLTVTVSDAAGNSTSLDQTVTVDTATPTAMVNPVAVDGIVNASEAAEGVSVTGTAGAGSNVVLTLGENSYIAEVAADGSWRATLPPAAFEGLADGRYDLAVTVTSASGNTGTSTVALAVDTTPPDFTLATPAGDGVLNSSEQAAGVTLNGIGSEGDNVSLTLNGITYTTSVDSNGQWALNVPAGDLAALPQGNQPINVTVTDSAGNSTTLASNLNVDTTPPTLTTDPVSGDNILNVAELGQPLLITGSGENGNAVSVEFNGKLYSTQVGVNGRWTIEIPATDLAGIANGDNPLTVSSTDPQGNQATLVTNVVVDADPAQQPTLTVSVDTFAGDGVVSAAEQQQPQTLTGSTTNVEQGQTVTVTLNGVNYSGTVDASGAWSVTVPASAFAGLADGSQTFSVSVNDVSGNTASTDATFTVDNTGSSVALAPVTGDNYLNALELAGAVTLDGSTSNVAEGSLVTVTLNGASYSTTVGADGNWSLTLPAGTLSAVADGALAIDTTVTDGVGNVIASNTATVNVLADTVFAPTLAPAFGDGILNASEAASSGILSGTSGVTGEGQSVSLTLNGTTYTGLVDGNGNWQVSLPVEALTALQQGNAAYTVTLSDIAGNTTTADGTIVVDTLAPSLTVATPSGDGVLNASEITQPLALTGSSEANAQIVASFNGINYSTTADDAGNWTINVPADALSGLTNGDYPLNVTATDAAGNATSNTSSLAVKADAASLPTLTLNAFAGDNIIDGAERQTDQILSGSTTNVEAGQTVTVTLNGQIYSASVQPSGEWSLIVPAGALTALADGTATLSVAVSDAAGNTVTSDLSVDVNSTASGLSLDALSEDNYLNAQEALDPLIVSGTSANVPEGSTVTVLFNNQTYTAQVSASGTWSAIIPATALENLPDGPITLTATTTDSTGVTVSSESTLNVAINTLPDVTVDTPFGDGVLNVEEATAAQTLTGTTGVSGDGQTITVTLNGVDYSGTVDATGNWSVTLPAEALNALTDGSVDYTVVASDAAGNTSTVTGSVGVDLTLPTLTLNDVAGDNIVNAAESAATITLTGSSDAGEGQQVTITLNGQTWTTNLDADGNWTFDLPAGALAGIPVGTYVLTATVSDAAGNSFTETRDITVATGELAVSITTPFGDGYLSSDEAAAGQTLSGNTGVTGDANQVVTVTLGGNDYNATVDAEGNWSLALDAPALQALQEGDNTIVVNVTDGAGNTGSLETSVTVDFTAPELTLDAITGDNIINSVEVLQDVPLSGTASPEDAGQIVTVTFNGQSYETQVLNDGTWNVTLPASVLQGLTDGSYDVDITLTDAAGNTTSITQSLTRDASVEDLPTLSINAVSEDNYLNQAEAGQDLIISGTSTNLTEGQVVTVTLNGQDYSTTVTADGSWSATVPAADVGNLVDGEQTLVVVSADTSGNPASQSSSFVVIAGDASQPSLTLDVIAEDDVVNATEAGNPLEITGSSQMLEGQQVTVTLNNLSYTATVDGSGNWSVTVPAGDLDGQPQGPLTVTASASDVAGNPATISDDITLDTVNPPLAAITLSSGPTLNLAEALEGLTITGTSDEDLPVSVSLNGVTYTTTVEADGTWSVTIPTGDLQQLADGTLPLTVSVTDSAGNTSTSTTDLTVAINTLPTLTLDGAPFGDGIISADDAALQQVLSGSSTGLAENTLVTVSIDTGPFSPTLRYSATVDAEGNWSITVPAGALDGLEDGQTDIFVTANDAAGNPAQISGSVEILLTPPAVPTIDPSFGDQVINASEATTQQVIQGSIDASDGETVSVSIDGTPLTVTVDASGNWTASLTPDQIAALADGPHTITVTTTDRAGNSTDATQDFTIDAFTPNLAPTLDTPFTDGRLNLSEAQAGGTLTGELNVDNAASVSVTVNGSVYAATINGDGTWSLDLPAALLETLQDGDWPITVTVTDDVGNSASTTGSLLVAINTLPDVSLALPFGDGSLSATEAQTAQTLSGTTGITGEGQTVNVVISGLNGDAPLSATVDPATGSWTLALSPDQLADLANGTHTITVTASDIAGNTDVTTLDVITAVTAPVPTFDADQFGGDNVLNIAEAGNTLTLTGTTGSLGDNQDVSLTVDLNGTRYTGTVASDGSWSVDIPAGALSNLPDGSHTLNLTVTDAAGNTVTGQYDFDVDLTAPVPTVDAQFNDGYLNADEVEAGFTLSGTTGEVGEGQTVVVTMGTASYTADVDANGIWTLPLSSAELSTFDDGTYTVTVTATDEAGNSTTISNTLTKDTQPPTVTVNDFTGDNALDYAESIQSQTLSGTATGAEVGSPVTVTFGAFTLTTTVDANGNWSVSVTPEQMSTLTSPTTVEVSISDLAGNAGTANSSVSVDLTPPAGPLVTLATVSEDNIISTTDNGTVVLNGTYANLGDNGAVNVVLNGTTYTTTLDGAGNWSLSLPVGDFGTDGTKTLSVTATGSEGSVTTNGTVTVDLTPPTLTVNTFAGDNTVNADESETSQTLSGTASVSEAGRTVVVTLNGKTYNAIVQGDGTWSTTVPAADMQALPEGQQTISAQLSDAAGNSTTTTENVNVDTSAPLIVLDAFLGDNVINAADIVLNQVLTGTATGAEGQSITLYAGDSSPIATAIVQPNGTFTFDLTPEVLGSLTEGALVLGARVDDAAGNQTEATLTINKVVNSALNLVVDSVFGDGTLNALDTAVAQTISGTATSAGVGAIVSVDIGGTTLSAAVGQDGKWAIVVPPSVLGLLSDGQLNLDITLTDAAGNTRTVGETVNTIVDNLPVVGDLTGLFGGDNLLNIAEAAAGQTLSGVVTAATGSTVTVTLGTHAYTSTVTAGGNWSVNLPPADLTSLLNGNLTLGVSVTDPVGNTASSSATIGVFTQQPSITLTSLFGDGVLNLADIATGQVISGVVNNVAQGTVVTLNVGSSTVNATVGADGAFSATVTPAILATLAQGNLTVGATLTDAAGNTATTSAGIRVDTTAPTITLGTLFGDGLLNAADALVAQTIGGVIGGAETGSRVVVTVAGQQFVTATDAAGNFGVTLTPTLLQGIADGNLTVGVSVTDSAGNTTSTTAGAQVGIHNLPTITLNPLFGDGVLNLAESLVAQTVSGTVANVPAGTTVNLAIGSYNTSAVVGANGNFSVQLLPTVLGTLLGSNFTVNATVADSVGNNASVSGGVQLAIGNQPTLTLNTVFGDGVLSAADLASNQVISGSSTNLAVGSTVTATLNGVSYSTSVVSGGTWSISVPKANLAAINDGTTTVTISATDSFGNVATGNGNLSVISHTAPVVTITSLFGDNALSVADVKTTQTISGTATNAEGSVVNVTVGGQTYSATVNASGAWSLSIPAANLAAIADGSYTVTANVTNGAGSSGSGAASLAVVSHTTPTVALNSYFGGDGYLNIAEASTTETISGTSTNATGGTVSVNVAGTVYTGSIAANGTWSVSVPSSGLSSISDGSHSLVVTVTDRGGNTAVSNSSFTALAQNEPLVGADPVLNVVTSLLTGLTVNGGSLYAAQGSTVKVTLLNGDGTLSNVSVTTTTDSAGRYSAVFSRQLLSVSGLLFSALSAAQIQITDAAGNSSAVNVTLLLGSLISVPAAAAASTLSVEDASVMATTSEDNSSTSNSSNGEETTAKVAATAATVDSTLTTEADTSTTTGSEVQQTSTATTQSTATEDHSYSIGGVVITLADGSTVEGASVTGSSGADTVAVSTLNFTHIDGGAGTDTLVLNGEHMTLDLVSLGLKVEHIEVLDLGKSGTNSVKLDLNEALNITDKQTDDLMIKGADGSQVTLTNANGGTWENTGQRAVDGHTFDVYHNSALTADNTLGDVLVQHNLQVHVV